jgi:sodium transport system permease protein
MFTQILSVLRTEFLDHSRDRRSLFASFTYALFGPLFLVIGLNFAVQQIRKTEDVKLAVIGADYAPGLVAELERRGLMIEKREDGADIPALNGADALLRIPAEMTERWNAGQPVVVTLYRDERRQASVTAARRVEQNLESYAREVAQARLTIRGVAAELTQPLIVDDANVATAQAGGVAMANMLLYFFLMAPFFGGMSITIDTTAGERERKSLRPLLVQPVNPVALVVGKWLNASLFSVVATTLTVVLGLSLLNFAPLEQLRISLIIQPVTVVLMILAMIPLCLAVVACQMIVGFGARNFKEAQMYISLLSIAPVFMVSITSFSGRDTGSIGKLMPFMGHADLLKPLLADGSFSLGQAMGLTAVTLLLLVAALAGVRQLLRHERILSAG